MRRRRRFFLFMYNAPLGFAFLQDSDGDFYLDSDSDNILVKV